MIHNARRRAYGNSDCAAARKWKLKERIRTIVSVLLSFLLVTFLVQNYRHQRETDQRLAEMQTIVQASVNRSPSTLSEAAANIHERGSVDEAG